MQKSKKTEAKRQAQLFPGAQGPRADGDARVRVSSELRAAFQHAEALRHAAKIPAYQMPRIDEDKEPVAPGYSDPCRSCFKLSDICCAPPSALRPVDDVLRQPVPLCAIFLVCSLLRH